ncbi:unnamed protein product [Fusarium langsethiae]|nr:unnamed protein product [Fusarium langsethiae]
MIWAPHARSNGQWIANKILQGFFGAPIESLCEISISDTYFTHERGTYMAFYTVFIAVSNFLAPVISGFISDGQGWQWVLDWCAIFNRVAFFILLFCMDETNYLRTTGLLQGVNEADITNEPTQITSDGEKAIKYQTAANSDTGNGSVRSARKTYFDEIKVFSPTRRFRQCAL